MVQALSLLPTSPPLNLGEAPKAKPGGAGELVTSFKEVLQEKLNALNDTLQRADDITLRYLTGQVEDIHEVMLALEEASLALQLAVQVRNKVIEAYQEISRMQV
ncbi:MAG: flagellar hook-basal body complex protein FliE [Thermanaeromonas sp.]|uniref:flagellar hook-basal body complex protein FliE n=1 Tax=Thermanaeromonas sp. TaxID=2003697 RepID=UPI00243AD9F8|nr:flagellar hook-basal body complex protein FliE [Thermanaeromonas sp.]MCG0278391.1 flagellar hook-basal body complex protein FliE [Thermanaeromonas sp.]